VTSLEGANQKRKRISAETPSTHGPDGPARKALACREGRSAGRLGQRPSGPVRPAGSKARSE
jgi:hypothetical protein